MKDTEIGWTYAAQRYLSTLIISPRYNTSEKIIVLVAVATRIAHRDFKQRVDEVCVREAAGERVRE